MILLAMGLRLMLFSWIVNLVASKLHGADEFPALIDATPFFPQLDGFRIRRWIVGLSDFCKNMFIYLGFTIEIGWNILLYNMYNHLDIHIFHIIFLVELNMYMYALACGPVFSICLVYLAQ